MVDKYSTKDTLRVLGLTDNEWAVYQGYLTHGETSAAELARKIGMDKSSVYRAVETLEQRRLLVKHFKKKGTTYIASPPSVLQDVYTTVKVNLESRKNDLDLLIEELKQTENEGRATYIVLEKGLPSWQYRMTESLECKSKLIKENVIDSHRFFEDKAHLTFVIRHAKERVRRGIKIFQLEQAGWEKNRDRFQDVMIDQKKYNKEIRLVPPDFVVRQNSFRIWDDTVNIVSYDDQGEFIVITIKDKFVVRLMENMYDFIWKRSDKVE